MRAVTTPDRGHTLYVNLSGDFVSRFTGSPATARLMLQSIVNTLTLPANNIGNARRVFFLIDTMRLESFHGVGEFNLAFEYSDLYEGYGE